MVFCIIASKACKLIGIIESPKMLDISFVETYVCYIKHNFSTFFAAVTKDGNGSGS